MFPNSIISSRFDLSAKNSKEKMGECGRWLVITTIVTNPHTKRWAFVCIVVASDIKL